MEVDNKSDRAHSFKSITQSISNPSASSAIIIAAFAGFGGILFGYDTGSISGILAMPSFIRQFSTEENPMTGMPYLKSTQTSLIVSILSAGTFVGCLSVSYLADKLGRRMAIMLACWIYTFGVILETTAQHIPVLVAGRFFAGFGVGLVSALVPLYQSEAAPKWIRGSIVSGYQFAITLGILVACIVNYLCKDIRGPYAYKITLCIQFLWASVLFGGMYFLPETPRWYVKVGKIDDARRSLARLRNMSEDSETIQQELLSIQASNDAEAAFGDSGWKDVFSKDRRQLFRLFTGCAIQALQQLTGVNFIFYYGTTFFKSAGIQNSFVISMVTSTVNVISTIPGLYLVEKLGRRSLLLLGAAGMLICEFLVAGLGLAVNSDTANKCLIAFTCIYILFFACSWGPVAWVLVGELYPLRTRAKSMALAGASNWFLNWLIGFSTPFLVDAGPGNANLQTNVFFIWAGFCTLCFIFTYFVVYETKGLSLEQIDELYQTTPRPWRIPSTESQIELRAFPEISMTNSRPTDPKCNAHLLTG
ncbi:Sugar/inositol transporter [Limtongia smithiae]|uniref:Sugar/inositol transporter n=1 Tax=Limtongia smithiae TaxID=1125753 RepID=UPI0034CE840C